VCRSLGSKALFSEFISDSRYILRYSSTKWAGASGSGTYVAFFSSCATPAHSYANERFVDIWNVEWFVSILSISPK
jgi:hypothetical protein